MPQWYGYNDVGSLAGGYKILVGSGATTHTTTLSALQSFVGASGGVEGGTSTMVAVIPSSTYPASGDLGVHINAAATAVGPGGFVKVYPVSGGWSLTTPIVVQNGAHVAGQGCVLVNVTAGFPSASDISTWGGPSNDLKLTTFRGFEFNCANRGRDTVRVSGGIQLRLDDFMIHNAGRDGFHEEVAFDGAYIECCYYTNIKVYGAARHAFSAFAGFNSFAIDYINQTTHMNCNARGFGSGNPLFLSVGAGTDSHKISEKEWINGELDSAGSSATDGVRMVVSNVGSGNAGPVGVIENVHFQSVAIEDAVTGTHAGHAINTGGTSSASVTNCILAGFAGGNNII